MEQKNEKDYLKVTFPLKKKINWFIYDKTKKKKNEVGQIFFKVPCNDEHLLIKALTPVCPSAPQPRMEKVTAPF